MEELETTDGMTSIMYGAIDSSGALQVEYFCETGTLSRDGIANKIKNKPKGLPVQDQPFWCEVVGKHRLVYTLTVPNWYFPCLRELQQGKLPFSLVSQDPHGFYSRPQIMSVRNIYGGDDKRIKTVYVDYDGGNQTLPYVFDLHINIWQNPNDPSCFKTPIVIDPGTGGRGAP